MLSCFASTLQSIFILAIKKSNILGSINICAIIWMTEYIFGCKKKNVSAFADCLTCK